MEVATVDWIIIGLVGLSALISLVRGFVKEAMSLVIWMVAFAVAVNFKQPASALLVNMIDQPSIRRFVCRDLTAWQYGQFFIG